MPARTQAAPFKDTSIPPDETYSGPDIFSTLPTELISLIFCHLGARPRVLALSQTSRLFQIVFLSDVVPIYASALYDLQPNIDVATQLVSAQMESSHSLPNHEIVQNKLLESHRPAFNLNGSGTQTDDQHELHDRLNKKRALRFRRNLACISRLTEWWATMIYDHMTSFSYPRYSTRAMNPFKVSLSTRSRFERSVYRLWTIAIMVEQRLPTDMTSFPTAQKLIAEHDSIRTFLDVIDEVELVWMEQVAQFEKDSMHFGSERVELNVDAEAWEIGCDVVSAYYSGKGYEHHRPLTAGSEVSTVTWALFDAAQPYLDTGRHGNIS